MGRRVSKREKIAFASVDSLVETKWAWKVSPAPPKPPRHTRGAGGWGGRGGEGSAPGARAGGAGGGGVGGGAAGLGRGKAVVYTFLKPGLTFPSPPFPPPPFSANGRRGLEAPSVSVHYVACVLCFAFLIFLRNVCLISCNKISQNSQ